MPKKYKAAYTNNNSYVHPSLGSAKPPAKDLPPGPVTVNERLHQLRSSNPSAELTQLQRDIAQESARHSVPPELRTLLGVTETAPPRPRFNFARTRLRTPGPPIPPSWLNPSQQQRLGSTKAGDCSKSSRASKHVIDRARPDRLAGFFTDAGQPSIDARSLVHIALRAIAQAWEDIDHDALEYLTENPVYLRTALLPYLGFFGPTEAITARQLEALLDAPEGLSCLDLTGLAGWTFGLRELIGVIARYSKRSATAPFCAASTAESWDDDDEDEDATTTPSISRLTLFPTPAITALSLALPPPTVSWTDLLSLTSHLPTLTHLSLASWPWPTKTPHLSSTSLAAPDGRPIPASGSSLYAALDADLSEARQLLRRLSGSTYCLRFLDVSGSAWTAALAPQPPPPSPTSSRLSNTTNTAFDPIAGPSSSSGPDWAGAWKLISTLVLARSDPASALRWVPVRLDRPPRPRCLLPDAAAVHAAALAWLRATHASASSFAGAGPESDWRAHSRACRSCGAEAGTGAGCQACGIVEKGLEGEFLAWLERESGYWDTAARIRGARRRARGVAGVVKVETGWGETGGAARWR